MGLCLSWHLAKFNILLIKNIFMQNWVVFLAPTGKTHLGAIDKIGFMINSFKLKWVNYTHTSTHARVYMDIKESYIFCYLFAISNKWLRYNVLKFVCVVIYIHICSIILLYIVYIYLFSVYFRLTIIFWTLRIKTA